MITFAYIGFTLFCAWLSLGYGYRLGRGSVPVVAESVTTEPQPTETEYESSFVDVPVLENEPLNITGYTIRTTSDPHGTRNPFPRRPYDA